MHRPSLQLVLLEELIHVLEQFCPLLLMLNLSSVEKICDLLLWP